MKPRQKKVTDKLMTFFLIFVKNLEARLCAMFTLFLLLTFHYTGEGRFVRETKEEFEDEEEDQTEMAKSTLTENDENDDTQSDESEGYYVLFINHN